MSRLASPAPRRIARITCEVLRPVPVAALEVAASIVRSGKRLDLVEARLVDETGAVVMVASAWRLPDERIDLPQKAGGEVPDASVASASERDFFPVSYDVGYHTATDWRFVRGAWLEPGPAMAWTRSRVPLVEGENPSWIERLLIAADTASGISAVLDPLVFFFKNVDLTVEVDRLSDEEWVGVDAVTDLPGTNVGFARATLFDSRGAVARSSQTLLIAARED
ncbi:MAG: thioesterase family protein [Actinomycetota bacterium]|nr:thioesterase family protein [Actinomycetota bacterium]